MGKRLITAEEVREAAHAGQKTLSTPFDECIVTPMAQDEAERLGVMLDSGVAPLIGFSTHPSSAAKLAHEVSDLLKTRLPSGTSVAKLENIVREVVAAKMNSGSDGRVSQAEQASGDQNGLRLIDHQRLLASETGPVPVDEQMLVAEAIGGEAEDKMAGGFMVWEDASFTRRVEKPEIAVVMEGELYLETGGSRLEAKAGDMVYFPGEVVVTYTAPRRVKLACVNCL